MPVSDCLGGCGAFHEATGVSPESGCCISCMCDEEGGYDYGVEIVAKDEALEGYPENAYWHVCCACARAWEEK